MAAMKMKKAAERIGGVAAERALALEKERKAERKVKELGTKESHQKMDGSALLDAEAAAKANGGMVAAQEKASKKKRKAELTEKDTAKELAVKQRAEKLRGCFIVRQCCPKEGESCAEPKQKEYRDEWGEQNEKTAQD